MNIQTVSNAEIDKEELSRDNIPGQVDFINSPYDEITQINTDISSVDNMTKSNNEENRTEFDSKSIMNISKNYAYIPPKNQKIINRSILVPYKNKALNNLVDKFTNKFQSSRISTFPSSILKWISAFSSEQINEMDFPNDENNEDEFFSKHLPSFYLELIQISKSSHLPSFFSIDENYSVFNSAEYPFPNVNFLDCNFKNIVDHFLPQNPKIDDFSNDSDYVYRPFFHFFPSYLHHPSPALQNSIYSPSYILPQ
jgi:hypothetical protein